MQERVLLGHWLKNPPRKNRAYALFGARRVGKTMLLKEYLLRCGFKYLYLNGEDADHQELLNPRGTKYYKELLGGYELLALDEAQHVPDVGAKLKLILDEVDGIRVVMTGSSVLDLAHHSGEPLTGRKSDFFLHPFSLGEWAKVKTRAEMELQLPERLVFGSYPELLDLERREEKVQYLKDLVSAYLLKDLLVIDGLRAPSVLMKILKMLALQIGQDCSYQELGNSLGISKNTVMRYLELLEGVFVIFSLSGFSGNLRKEISKSKRWYFMDNGVRNALLNDFLSVELRKDVGMLWENFMVSEWVKKNHFHLENKELYFWRTYDGQELDLVEVRDGKVTGFEFKWARDARPKVPGAWARNYADSGFEVVTPRNYLEILGD